MSNEQKLTKLAQETIETVNEQVGNDIEANEFAHKVFKQILNEINIEDLD